MPNSYRIITHQFGWVTEQDSTVNCARPFFERALILQAITPCTKKRSDITRLLSPCDKIFLHVSRQYTVCSGNFCTRDVRITSPTTKCGAFCFCQEIFVHATYVPFHQLPSVGLSGFFRKFCARDVPTSSTDNTGARSGSPQ